jgi:CheY-like chemotaxis protein
LQESSFETSMKPGPVIVLEVKDNGGGMSAEVLERIFEPYFSTKFTGRGLGLAAVQGIVRGHEAALFVTSQFGQGTVFRICFPAIVTQSAHYRQPRTSHPRVVLVVDDETDILELSRDYLSRMGIRALVAADARTALHLIDEYRNEIQAVILDYLMPHMSGIKLLQKIQQVKDVDIYLTSGYTRGEISSPEIRGLLTGFIAKPFRFEDFQAMFPPRPE